MNTYEDPNRVLPKINTDAFSKDGRLHTRLDRLSWNVFRFHVDGL